MHRPGFGNPAPAQSPPLHHPVPQHVSTVPQLRSPPPPATQQQQQQSGYGYGGQPQQPQGQGANAWANPAFGGFVNDTTAQMGIQVGQSALNAGQQYVEQNFGKYVNVSTLKHYFNVSNGYVLHKLYLVLFPWRHRPWSRRQSPTASQGGPLYLPPREDINSPDMYIPSMALVTYILFSTILAGIRGQFQPELFGTTLFNAGFVILAEIGVLKLGSYLLSISNEAQLLDLVAYAGYKFVHTNVTLIIAEVVNAGQGTGGWIGWAIFLYMWGSNAFFLLRSLKYVLIPDSSSGPQNAAQGGSYTLARAQKTRRGQFLFAYSYLIQFVLMWVLMSGGSGPAAAAYNAGAASVKAAAGKAGAGVGGAKSPKA